MQRNRNVILSPEEDKTMSANSFVGAWKLISFDATRENGKVLPVYGKNPIGRLYYDVAGNMSLHVMKSGRANFDTRTKFRVPPSEMRAAYESYEAYFSTYKVDEANHIITHTVIGSLFPDWTGTVQSRYYKFDGNRLILSTGPIGCVPKEGTFMTLVWERLDP